jgi:hypothetical protein
MVSLFQLDILFGAPSGLICYYHKWKTELHPTERAYISLRSANRCTVLVKFKIIQMLQYLVSSGYLI